MSDSQPSERARPPRQWLHPLSGAALLGFDWLVFTSGWLTALVALPLASVCAALATAAIVWWAQRRDGDGPSRAAFKAFVAAALVAVPLPIAGTAVGTAVLTLSGLRLLRR